MVKKKTKKGKVKSNQKNKIVKKLKKENIITGLRNSTLKDLREGKEMRIIMAILFVLVITGIVFSNEWVILTALILMILSLIISFLIKRKKLRR